MVSDTDSRRIRRFEQCARLVLGYAIAVIVWGAVVRATGSGAGCGAHWPLCNGDVLPLTPRTATIIEFAHRTTSGLILVLSLLLVAAAFRVFPPRHAARDAAVLAFVFVIIEAAIGAGIVLLQLVEHNASALRAGYVSVHLMNTLLLVGALTATLWAARPRAIGWPPGARVRWARLVLYGLISLLVVSAAGAIVALGDTLFPHATLAAGLAADFDPASHVLIRLRVWHPILAAAASIYIVTIISRSDAIDEPGLRTPARWAVGLVCAQVVLGVVNLLALAPLWLQMAHLLVSNALWVAVVWLWLQLRGGLTRRS
jgi:cytochrome c oxidase assembly protein subunit 15